MADVVTLPVDATLNLLLALPTATVARATRAGDPIVDDLDLSPEVVAELFKRLEASTGSADWALEHFREPRPLGEFLEVQRLIRAQHVTASGLDLW